MTPLIKSIVSLDILPVYGHWEKISRILGKEHESKGYNLVMTSTLSNEQAQHFYRKLGYKDSGSLLLEDEPLEIILAKKI